jgi:MFS family permease
LSLREPAPRDSTRAAIGVLALCLLLNLVGRGTADTYVVFLLPLERDLGWSRSEMTSVYSVYLLVNGLTAPLIGLIFDRVGPRVVYGAGMAGLAMAYLLASRIESLWHFYATVGAITGFAVAALGMVPSSSLLARWFRERLSTAMSIAFAGLGLGALLIVPATQSLLSQHGWRETYQILGIILLLAVPVVLVMPWKTIVAGHPEYRSERKRGSSAARDWTLRDAARTLNFWSLAWIFFFTSVGMFSVTVQTVVYLVEQGFSAILAATVFGAASMASVFGIVTTGALADRYGPRRTVTATYAGSIAGIVVLFIVSWQARTEWLMLYVIVFGLCQGARGPIISSITTRLFAGRQVATIYGVIYACNAFGAGLGALMAGVIHDLTGSYRPGFVFAVACLLVAVLPFWRVPDLRDFRTRR